MKTSMNRYFVLVYFVVMTTINASRIFYIPSPKLRSTHYESNLSPVLQRASVRSYKQNLIHDEFTPPSTTYSNMYEEAEYSQNNDLVDWEALVDEELARRFPGARGDLNNQDELDYLNSLDRETRKPKNRILSDNINDAEIDNRAAPNEKPAVDETWSVDPGINRAERLESVTVFNSLTRSQRRNDVMFLAIVGTSTLIGVLGLISALIFWYKIQKKAQTALDAEYPSYGVSGPGSSNTVPKSAISDRKLAQSAQMFHYQQQRQQMMAQEKTQFDARPANSDDSDDEVPGGGDYTVYECPGLAPTGEMEVRNPLFTEADPSVTSAASASYPAINNHYPQPSSSPPKEMSSP